MSVSGGFAWDRTIVCTEQDEQAITDACRDGVRVMASRRVQPGSVYVLNDEYLDQLMANLGWSFGGDR